MNKSFIILVIITLLASCKENQPTKIEGDTSASMPVESMTKVDSIINQTLKSHAHDDFIKKEGVQFEIKLEFNGKERLDALLSMTTDSRNVRLDLADGGVILYDGNKVYSNWKDGTDAQARFDIFTWSYFFALPYKINDPGTFVTLNNYDEYYHKIHLTFSSDTGDTPDDWYDLYIDKKTDLLCYAGYIVTYGGADQVEASKNAHAIGYENYKNFDRIPVSSSWNFYNYSDSVNKEDKIGQAVLSQIVFGKINDSLFKVEEGMHEVLLP